MNRLSALFEEDIEMQDALEDIETITDNSEDIIIGAIEDRYKDTGTHLFDNEGPVNDDGLTEEEELEVMTSLLSKDDDISDDDVEAFADDEDI